MRIVCDEVTEQFRMLKRKKVLVRGTCEMWENRDF